MKRAPFEHYFLLLAFAASIRSEDPNRRVGAVCVDEDNRILSTGYNGFAKGLDASAILAGPPEIRRGTIFHAEQNALLLCKRNTVKTLAVTTFCCGDCARYAANHGVSKIIYCYDYKNDTQGYAILKLYNITVQRIPVEELKPYTLSMFDEVPTQA